VVRRPKEPGPATTTVEAGTVSAVTDKKKVRVGNWTPDGKLERARLREDYENLTPEQRVSEVIELSRFMAKIAAAGRKSRAR
jgi:hypothetical protein